MQITWPIVEAQNKYGPSSDTVIFLPMSIECMTKINSEDTVLEFIGEVAGECYNSSKDILKCIERGENAIKRGHHSPWEHFVITIKSTVDRGTSHALVRHRHCAYMQSSTIYQKYKDCIYLIDLPNMDPCTDSIIPTYTSDDIKAFETAYERYACKLEKGWPPHRARDFLPTCLATNLIITTNIRQWMYMIHRRCGPGDSERMHVWDMMIREFFEINYPKITAAFDKWYAEHPL